jgi:predicted dehydrogenase
MIRLALIGAGAHAVEQHVPALLAHADAATIAVVCDRHAERAAAAAAPFHARTVATWQDALAADIDAVIICTRADLTPTIALAAQARGLPMLMEKPLADDLAGAEALCARLAGHPAMASMNRRFDPAFTHLRQLAAARAPRAWRGVLARQGRSEPEFLTHTGVHLLDALVHLAGAPDSAGCRYDTIAGGTRITWTGAAGAEVTAEIVPQAGCNREQIEASGDGFHAEARSAWFDDGTIRLRATGSPVIHTLIDAALPLWRRNGTDAETAAFIAACAGRGPWSPHPAEVLPATRIAFAAPHPAFAAPDPAIAAPDPACARAR